MKIVIRELREGSNPIRFTFPAAEIAGIVSDMDALYDAAGDGEVELDLQKYNQLMHLAGAVRAPIRFECARCLAPRRRSLDISIHWTLLPKNGQGGELSEKEEIELSADDLDTSFYEGEEIDLSELAREAILLELDPIPYCSADETCSPVSLAAEPADDDTPPVEDPRWAPLKKLLGSKQTN